MIGSVLAREGSDLKFLEASYRSHTSNLSLTTKKPSRHKPNTDKTQYFQMNLAYHFWVRLQICLIVAVMTVHYAQTFVPILHVCLSPIHFYQKPE